MGATSKLSNTEVYSQLKGISDKIRMVEHMDYYKNPPVFTEEEDEVLNTLRPIVEYLLYPEIHRLNHKLKTHHHIVMSVEDGMKFRDKGFNKPDHRQKGEN